MYDYCLNIRSCQSERSIETLRNLLKSFVVGERNQKFENMKYKLLDKFRS